MRLAQVECEALSHRFPRERTKKVFFRVSMFRVLFRVFFVLWITNSSSVHYHSYYNARNTTPTEERIRSSIRDAKANIYTYTYI